MRVVLGVSGSVAAFRAADLARELMRQGAEVRVCLTDAAQKFVSVALFEALTGQPCLVDTFEEPNRGRMAHIDWARQADLVIVAPATANTVAKLAHGVGDDMLTTLVLASTKPLLVAPAMNPSMYTNEAFQEALRVLMARGAMVIEPAEGDVACGENGQGKLASISAIVAAALDAFQQSKMLAGKTVLITSGPTREPLDDVRYLSNRSSGKMGAAVAQAALQLGAAKVRIVTGPVSVVYPAQAEVAQVMSAEEMLESARAWAPDSDLIIGVAAVADYRPQTRVRGKMRRSSEPLQLVLEPNPDIISELARVAPKARVVGFAAEPSADLAVAREKLARKGLFAIAANDVSDTSIGFESGQNELSVVFADGRVHQTGRGSKLRCALSLLQAIGAD
jgi:phosphopantothenoylcysteine decarboxylase/phosphopantothenate--cysteine ligase